MSYSSTAQAMRAGQGLSLQLTQLGDKDILTQDILHVWYSLGGLPGGAGGLEQGLETLGWSTGLGRVLTDSSRPPVVLACGCHLLPLVLSVKQGPF